MSAPQHSGPHRVTDLARQVCEDLAGAVELPMWSMSTADSEDALVLLTRARSQLEELLMRVLRQAQAVRVGADAGLTTVTWWANATRTTRAEANRTAQFAESIERHEDVASALALGTLRTDQARAVVDAVEGLPADRRDSVSREATAFLLDKAVEHDAKALRILGRRVLEVIDPEAADAEEARRLVADEADAHASASLIMADDGHGRTHGRFSIPTLHGEILRKHLFALLAPPGSDSTAALTAPTSSDVGETCPTRRPTKHRMGLAFLEYLETRPEGTVPSAGGVPATVVVTMELETLVGGLKAASLDTGARISAGEARRLACRAGIIPVVLGGPSVVLDVGRKRRFHTETQRIALATRDGGCTAAGCDKPPGFTQAHHNRPWSQGGGTSVAHGRLLCPPHHRLIHDPSYHHSLDKHGKVRFSRRT